MLGMSPLEFAGVKFLSLDADALGQKLQLQKNGEIIEVRGTRIDQALAENGLIRPDVQSTAAYQRTINQTIAVPEVRGPGLVSNTIGPDFGQPVYDPNDRDFMSRPIVQTVTKTATGVGTGHIVLLGLLALYLLKGRSRE